MESFDRLNRAISYIENNLSGEVDYNEISKITLSPISSFQRFFNLTAGMSLSEYIRRRKLSCAASEILKTDNKIIDIAMKYGYESADAFSTAFKRMYNISPSETRKKCVELVPFNRLYFNLSIISVKGDRKLHNFEKFEITNHEPLRFIGKSVYFYAWDVDSISFAKHLWANSDWIFSVLDEMKEYEVDANNAALRHWNMYEDKGTSNLNGWGLSFGKTCLLGYTVGRFMKAGTPVPKGMNYIDIPEGHISKSWLKRTDGWIKKRYGDIDDILSERDVIRLVSRTGCDVIDEGDICTLINQTDNLKDAPWKFAAEIAPVFGEDGLPVYGKYVACVPLTEEEAKKRKNSETEKKKEF